MNSEEDTDELGNYLPSIEPEELSSHEEVPGVASGLSSADPATLLEAGKERMKQLTELKARMKAQAQARQEAMQRLASLYEQPISTGMDPGLIALGKGIASGAPGQELAGFTSGMQGMQEARQKLAERDWARRAAAEKIRAQSEQQDMADLLNEGKLDISMMKPAGRTFAPRDFVLNGHHVRDTYNPNTGQWDREDLGVAPSGMKGAMGGAHLKAGYQWVTDADGKPKKDEYGNFIQMKIPEVDASGKPMPSAVVPGIGSWTDDALQEAALRYSNGDDTVLHNIGQGKDASPIKAEIRNRAAQIHKDAGVSPSDATDYAQQQRAISGSLLQITKQKTAVGAFERTALNNLDLALKASDNVDRTGIPIFNKWLQAGRTATGSPEASKFHAANETFINEYAKVMSGGTGAAATTDSATEHARSLLNTAMTPEQYKAVMGQLKQEMTSRMSAFDQEIDHLKSTRPGQKKPVQNTEHPEDITNLLGKYGKH